MQLRDHTFLGLTQSLCPECLSLVPSKIIERGGRVYFQKRCPTHGLREDFVCSDAAQYDQMEFSLPGRLPDSFGTSPERGCPFDCGLCSDHEQHTCVGLVEITASCNLECPFCYAHSGPGGQHLTLEECCRAIDRLVEAEGRPEVLQLSGGEPTIHPQFEAILNYACSRRIDIVMINTNGVRLAHDETLLAELARHRRLEVYLQFDGFEEQASRRLRGVPLVETKLRAVENLGRYNIHATLVTTLQPDVNEHEIGAIVRFGLERPWVTGVSFQPATYSGRYTLPSVLERRITFPDVVRAVAEQTDGLFAESDFMPLACAHPNCHSLAYAYRAEGEVVPLTRFIDARQHLELLANGITFTRARARELIETYLGSQGCCAGGACHGNGASPMPAELPLLTLGQPAIGEGVERLAAEFFRRALAEQLAPADVFRVTITSFLDAYNFDVRRLMKCCIHHVLPSGHLIPFCAYNVLYRDGHVPLPALRRALAQAVRSTPIS